jgi:hypothetical protein
VMIMGIDKFDYYSIPSIQVCSHKTPFYEEIISW